MTRRCPRPYALPPRFAKHYLRLCRRTRRQPESPFMNPKILFLLPAALAACQSADLPERFSAQNLQLVIYRDLLGNRILPVRARPEKNAAPHGRTGLPHSAGRGTTAAAAFPVARTGAPNGRKTAQTNASASGKKERAAARWFGSGAAFCATKPPSAPPTESGRDAEPRFQAA